MINVISKTCEHQECKIRATFNFEGEIKARFCNEHKEIGMINVLAKTCEHQGCKIQPTFNFEGLKKRFCNEHKEIGMIDVKSKTCEHQGCKIRPSFNFEGEIKARFCNEHKKIAMIDIKSKTCEHLGCKTIPTFNFKGQIKKRFCNEHKEIGMVDIKNKTCEHDGCKTRPGYNFEGEIKARFCNEHKEIGMIDVKSKTCEHLGCKTIPTFNFKGQIRFCNEHKEIGMINVKHKTCEHDGCKTRANFGYINQIGTRCARHKLPLMFQNRKVECQEENCLEISEYGKEEPIHCFLHQKKGELCLLGQVCKQCNRENELCNSEQICFTYCRPNELSIMAKKIIKKKEGLVLSYLDKNIKTDIKPIDDRIIDASCVKRRPDRIYDCGSYFVIIEIDEYQHKSYSNSCSYDAKKQELRRMVQIHEALSNGMMPVIFLRFNPDNFRVKDKIQKVNMQKRLEILSKWLLYCLKLDDINKKPIQIKHLFFDEYNESNLNFEHIDDIKKLI